MKKDFLFIVLFLLISVTRAFSQADGVDTSGYGHIEIIADPRIAAMVEKHIKINAASKTLQGFRVQIFSDSGNEAKKKANVIKSSFLQKYPDQPAYLIWQSPNFKIRVGDFRTRLDAIRFHKLIQGQFSNSFIVKDNIDFPALE